MDTINEDTAGFDHVGEAMVTIIASISLAAWSFVMYRADVRS